MRTCVRTHTVGCSDALSHFIDRKSFKLSDTPKSLQVLTVYETLVSCTTHLYSWPTTKSCSGGWTHTHTHAHSTCLLPYHSTAKTQGDLRGCITGGEWCTQCHQVDNKLSILCSKSLRAFRVVDTIKQEGSNICLSDVAWGTQNQL